MAVDLGLEDREVGAHGVDVEGRNHLSRLRRGGGGRLTGARNSDSDAPLVLGIRLDGVTAAIIAITVNAAAYIAEIVRGSYLSVPNGLREAGMAMGLSGTQTLVSVISPIAVRRLIPPLGNQFIISLKDTSLFIVIGVSERTRLLFIEKGHIIVDDNPRTVLANPEHPRLRDFLAHVA